MQSYVEVIIGSMKNEDGVSAHNESLQEKIRDLEQRGGKLLEATSTMCQDPLGFCAVATTVRFEFPKQQLS